MDFFANLTHLMMTAYRIFDRTKNPVASGPRTLSILTYVLAQYSVLPREITGMLETSKSRAAGEGWMAVVADLSRNLAEERGRDTDDKSHYQILLEGLFQDFGLDFRRVVVGEFATSRFIGWVYTHLRNGTPHYAIGISYALECSAVPELKIVYELVHDVGEQMQRAVGEDLQDFFDRHLALWEPGHEAGLRLACQKYLRTDADKASFEQGFLDTIGQMEIWWQGMAEEAAHLLH